MPGIELMELTDDDWELFRELRLAALAEAPYAFGSRHADWEHAPEDQWRQRLEAVDLNLVARIGDTPVGMVSGHRAGDRVELISMWVAPPARRRGVSRLLVDAVVSWAEGLGLPTYLMVHDDNTAAIASYRLAGFVDAGIDPEQGPEEPPGRLMMRPAAGRPIPAARPR